VDAVSRRVESAIVLTVRLASERAPDRPVNEDAAFAVGGLVGVLDGVSVFDGVETGCVHGPAWYVRRLSDHLTRVDDGRPLVDLLAGAIQATHDDHCGRCDLGHPGSPASTVCLLKDRGPQVEYLVLCDSPLVLDRDGGIQVITDDRFERAVAALRQDPSAPVHEVIAGRQHLVNSAEGYWIASTDPAAAYAARTGTVPVDGLRRAALLSDGAAAAVELFGLVDWRGLLDLLAEQGPAELIRQVRKAEYDADDLSRHKRHDDASAALCVFG